VPFTRIETMAATERAQCDVLEPPPAATDEDTKASGEFPAPQPAEFLLSESGAAHLEGVYGFGAKLLKEMGWASGSGLGRSLEGVLEPASILLMDLPSTHRGRRDRRCLGLAPPEELAASDAPSLRSRSPDRGGRRRSVQTKPEEEVIEEPAKKRSRSRGSSRSSEAKRSKSRSESESSEKKKKKKKKKRKRSSSSKSSTISSSSSRSRRKKKKKSKFKTASDNESSKPAGGAAGGAAPAPAAAAPAAPAEDPETAQAKKMVLAKLTEIKNVEPKEERAKQFRLLLRDWHPDKNPEKKDMATAVFQFLQKGKSLLNLKN
jgi:hypothetical protein